MEKELENCSVVAFNQVWQNKYSSNRIKITGHIMQFLWECINVRNNKTTQITEYELIESWTLSHDTQG